MNEPKEQQEPSMEEILASIRRIISEDEPGDGAKAEADSDASDSDASDSDVSDSEASDSDTPDSEDVLELTDVAEDVPEEAEEPAEDLSDEAPEEEPVEEEIDFDAPADDDLELREEAEVEEPPPEAVEPVEQPEAPVAAAPAQPIESALLGAEPAGSATGSLASLVQAVDRAHGGTPLGDANRTIEDLVKEVMRPMIREWLDENLPGLVERLVRREIERLSRTAEGDD